MADIRLEFGVDKGTSKINIEKDLTDIVNQLPTFGIKVGVNSESLQEFKAQLESTKDQIAGLKDFNLNLGGANVAIQTAGELDAKIEEIRTELQSISQVRIDFSEVKSFSEVFAALSDNINTVSVHIQGISAILKSVFSSGPGMSDFLNLSSKFENLSWGLTNIEDQIQGLGTLKISPEFKNSLTDIKLQVENINRAVNDLWSSFATGGLYASEESTMVDIKESFNGIVNSIKNVESALAPLKELHSNIRDIHESLIQLNPNSDTGLGVMSLSSYFEDISFSVRNLGRSLIELKSDLMAVFQDPQYETLSIKLGEEFAKIKETIKENKTEVYNSGGYFESSFTDKQADNLTKITTNIATLTEQLSKIPEILTQIAGLVDTISKKEFSVTNNFTGNLESLKDKAQEIKLYRDKLLELYKVVREYNTEAERMVQQRYVNGEANKIFQQIPGTGMSNIFEMIQQLDELGTSERSIYSMSNMKSIEAKMGKLNELKGIYETLFQEVQKYQQAESNSTLAKSGFKINAPDMTAFQKATEALDTYQNKITEIKTAAAEAASKQLTANQDKERLEAAKQIAAVVEQSLATPQQQLNEIQTKLTETFDLSKITPNAEKITQTLSGIKQQLVDIQNQIRTTFDLSTVPFDTTKITTGINTIKTQLAETQAQIGSIFDPSKIAFDPKSLEQFATAARSAFDLTSVNLDTSKFTTFTTEISQQLVRIQNQLRTTFNTSNLVIDTAKVDDFLVHTRTELVRIQNQLRETFNGARLVVDTAKVGDFTTEVKRQIAEVKAEIATIFDLSGITFDYSKFDEFSGKIKEGFDKVRNSVKSSLDGIKAYIDEVSVAYANLLVHIDKAANNPVVQKVAATTPVGGAGQTAQQAVAVHELAQAHVELAQAETQSTKAATEKEITEQKRLAMARMLFSTEEQLARLINTNSMDQSVEHEALKEAFLDVSSAADVVRDDITLIDTLFKDKASNISAYLSRVRTEIASYKAQLQVYDTGGTATESQFYGAIAAMKKIESSYPGQSGTAAFDNIIAKLNEFRRAEDMVVSGEKNINEALNEIGYYGTSVFSDINGLIKEFNAQMTGETSIKDISAQITSLTSAIASAKSAEKNGKLGIIDSAQFKQVETIVENFKTALRGVRDDGKTSSEAFSEFGLTVTQAFDNAKISISDLKTLVNETEKVVKEKAAPAIKQIDATQLNKSIKEMQVVLNSIESKKLYSTRNTQEYAELIKQITNAKQALAELKANELTAEEAISKHYQNGAQYIEQYKNAVSAFNVILAEAQGDKTVADNAAKVQAQTMKDAADAEAKAAKEARDLKDAYQQVYDKILQMQSVLGTARGKNSALIDTQAYKTVEGYLARFQNLSDVATGPARAFTNIFDIFKASGPDFENSMRAAKLAMTQLRIEMGETEKEAAETEPKITSLAKAYDLLTRGNKLLNRNPEYKGTAEYADIANNIAELQRLVDLVDKGVMTVGGTYRKDFANLDEVFVHANIDGEKLFETLRVGISRFNNELAQTEKSMSLDQAYKKLESMQSLLSSKKGKTLIGTDEYNAVQNSINQMDKAIKIAEGDQISLNQAFEQMNTISSKALADMDLAMAKFKVLRSGTSVTDIDKVMRETQTAQNLLNNNQSMANDITYQKLKSNIDLMNEAISKARANGRTLDVELKEMGHDGQKVFQDIKLGVLDFKAAMEAAGVSGTTTEKQLQDISNALNKLKAQADKLQGVSYTIPGSKAPTTVDWTQNEQYQKLQAQIQLVAQALNDVRNNGLSADEALAKANTSGKEFAANVALNSSILKGTIDQTAQLYREATTGTRLANQEEKKRQELLAKAYSLMSKSQKISSNWTMAATGKSAESYRQIQGYANALGNLISQFKNGSMTSAEFSSKLATIDAGLKQGTATIQAAGENAASLSLKLNNIAQRFGAWFGATRIIMKVITSLKQMISTSIELDDAFTQLQIVTKDTEASYERFGSTVARIAKETAVSMKDITDAATTFARLGYNLEDAAKLAEYTAKLQNVGDIETQEAQDAITSILKAYDDVDADHIEEVMDKLVETGNNFPISVSQIAEGMTNASSALAAAGNTFDQSVALLTAANTTLKMRCVA